MEETDTRDVNSILRLLSTPLALHQRVPAYSKETYIHQKRPIQEIYRGEFSVLRISSWRILIKERDLQKRPVKETN